MPRRMLVTHALPYANGKLHLGHLVESVQADVFVRAMNLLGREAIFICADDTHGTPIEISAAKAGVRPEDYIEAIHRDHLEDYRAFGIDFDLFYTTHSKENEQHAGRIFEALKKEGAIEKRDVLQVYCGVDKRFLPDRYIRGTCPVCGTADQYGDSCEHCGSTYEPTELKNPRCSICGNTELERRSSPHYFVKLSNYQKFLIEWTGSAGRLQQEIKNFVDKWLAEPLRDWDISRDAPYFGFLIPGETAKYFYVWLDAPVGYLSSTEHWCQEQKPPRRVEEFWGKDADCEIVHFIGKDIVYFHTLFWPAMLHASGWKVPARVHVHGMLTVEGAKMSKSRGTFLNAREYLDAGLEPEWLRYFYASNLGATPSDIDLSLNELKNRVNGELLANLGNLANRALSLIWKNGQRLTKVPESRFFEQAKGLEEAIARDYEACDTRALIQRVLAFSSEANQRLQQRKPWELFKTSRDEALSELTLAVNVARLCARWLAPIVPQFAEGVAEQSGAPLEWGQFSPLEDVAIREPRPLVRKVEDKDIEKLSSKFVAPPPAAPSEARSQQPEATSPAGSPKPEAAPSPPISIDDFAKLDLRAGKILAAERVPRKDRLLKLSIDLGEPAPRSIVSGVAKSYAPEELVGKIVAVVANLPPRDFGKGLVSHGMVLYAGGGTREHTAVELPAEVAPGSKVK